MSDFDPLKALIKTARQANTGIDILGKYAPEQVRKAMREANKQVNGSYPIAYEHMKRSIDRKSDITHGPKSKIAQAILKSDDFKALVKKQRASMCFANKAIFFLKDRDLARTLYRASISGDLMINDKDFEFKGQVTDTYDFRFSLIPAKTTLRGFALRYAGNAAYLAQELNLMKSYKITVNVEGKGKY